MDNLIALDPSDRKPAKYVGALGDDMIRPDNIICVDITLFKLFFY